METNVHVDGMLKIYSVEIDRYSAYILVGNCFLISVYLGFNTKENTEIFSWKESTRCSCLSFCKL